MSVRTTMVGAIYRRRRQWYPSLPAHQSMHLSGRLYSIVPYLWWPLEQITIEDLIFKSFISSLYQQLTILVKRNGRLNGPRHAGAMEWPFSRLPPVFSQFFIYTDIGFIINNLNFRQFGVNINFRLHHIGLWRMNIDEMVLLIGNVI